MSRSDSLRIIPILLSASAHLWGELVTISRLLEIHGLI